MEFNPHSTKAIVAKGEALYKMGLFENALVQFHRGWRFRADPAIKLGMTRCRDEILNTLGNSGKDYDLDVVEKVFKQTKDLKFEKEPVPKSKNKKGKKKEKPTNNLKKEKLTLGKMNEDLVFLRNFVAVQKDQPMKTKYTVS